MQMKFEMPRQPGQAAKAGRVPQEASLEAKPERTWTCDICGKVMLDLHCRLRCTNCGFMRDCSDP